MNRDIKNLFNKLRKDVQDYFESCYLDSKNLDEEEILSLSDRHRLNLYHNHKNNLSRICGWDSQYNYDQDMFDLAVEYLSNSLLIGVEAK